MRRHCISLAGLLDELPSLSTSDAKLRVQEEEEDGMGIVLSPQRRSFGTGCHVTTSIRPPTPDRESDRDRGGESYVHFLGVNFVRYFYFL